MCVEPFTNETKIKRWNELMALSNARAKWMHTNAQSADMQPPNTDPVEFNPLGIL